MVSTEKDGGVSGIKLYRPSNGTEGECFMGRWCAVCRHDRPAREPDGDPADGCSILCRTFATTSTDDPEYPREWRYSNDGHPVCTAFCWDDTEPHQPLDPDAVIRPLL